MRFKVAKRDLEAAIQVVGASIAGSGSDISAHFTFRRIGPDSQDKYGIESLTYSGRTFASCPLAPVAFEDVGGKKAAFTIEGWRLKQWLKFIPADSVPDFTLADGEVTARVKRGAQTFQSLDPSTFPYWDKVLKEAEVKATLPANRLKEALAYSRQFIHDDEANEPDKCVCEATNSILYSSDKKAVTLIKVKGMEESGLRVHGKDVAGCLTFLGTVGDGDVEILEHDRMTLLRRCVDGAVFGESKFHFKFPVPKLRIEDKPQHTWDIVCEDLRQVLGFLVAGAAPEDNRLRLAPGETPGEVILSMANTSGKTTSLTISGVTMASEPSAPEIPEEGFQVDHVVLSKILHAWQSDTIKFGILFSGGRGLVRFVQDHLDSTYLTVIGHLT